MSRSLTPRRAERKQVKMVAQCRTQSGLRDKGYISDISTAGCCVTTNSLFFRVGSRVVIRPEGMEGLTGVVRWLAGDMAGIQFDVPIYEPVVEHLAALHASGIAVTVDNC